MPLQVDPHTAAATVDARLHQHHQSAAAALPSGPGHQQHAGVEPHTSGATGDQPHAAVSIDGAALINNKDPAAELPPPIPGSEQAPAAVRSPLKARLATFAVNNFMLLSFSVAAALAMAWPLPGKVVASWAVGDVRVVQAINNFLVFLISGLTLKSDDFRALLKHWLGIAFGLLSILAVSPCFAWLMLALPFQPREFATGLALFCIVPTTLGVGVALTAASKGNQALALLLTVVTNLLGIVTVPYTLRLVLSSSGGTAAVSVEPQALVVKLLLTVLVPTVLGKLARDFIPPVCRFVTRYKTQLSMFSTLNLAAIVWQTLSGARDTLLHQAFTSILAVVAASSLLHVVLLVVNGLAVRYALRLPYREAVAVCIMSAQKSAPVAVTVISYLTPDLVQQGLMAIPCILGQLAQIFIGSALSSYLRGWAPHFF